MATLHDRVRSYEDVCRVEFPPRTPIIVRVDGRAFHTLTRKFQKPTDQRIVAIMGDVAVQLFRETGAVLAYLQSDEISLLLTPYLRFESQAWFGGSQMKIASVAASIAARTFINRIYELRKIDDSIPEIAMTATFDGRAFVAPREDVSNVFLGRQHDCRRNAILGSAQAKYGKKHIHRINCDNLMKMLVQDGAVPTETELMGRVVVKTAASFLEGDGRSDPVVLIAPAFVPEYFQPFVYPENEEGR
jgi:tRNA(His) guanylyltransferase